MKTLKTMTYEVTGKIARITFNRPERGNAITMETPRELAWCVEQADLDPAVHVIALSGRGKGFCGGYDLMAFAEGSIDKDQTDVLQWDAPKGSALDPLTLFSNHVPAQPWDPMIDYQMMSRNVKGFMSLFHANKPVVCKVHGFCVAGGTDMALCSDLMVIEDNAKIGYPPARVWGSPTTSIWVFRIGIEKTKRLLFTGDCLNGREAVEWGLAIESAPGDKLDERFEILLERIARMPVNQLIMMNRRCWRPGWGRLRSWARSLTALPGIPGKDMPFSSDRPRRVSGRPFLSGMIPSAISAAAPLKGRR